MFWNPYVSFVMCHMSHFTKKKYIILDQVVELVGRGSVMNGAYPV